MTKYAQSPNLPHLVREFANHELAIKNKSELTVDEYILDLTLFFRFLKMREAEARQFPCPGL